MISFFLFIPLYVYRNDISESSIRDQLVTPNPTLDLISKNTGHTFAGIVSVGRSGVI